MLIKTLSAAVAALAIAAPLAAETHEILMLEGGYFPDITYVASGDTVNFVNGSNVAQATSAVGGSWTTGTLSENQSFSMTVTQGTTITAFSNPANAEMVGSLSFDPAPLN